MGEENRKNGVKAFGDLLKETIDSMKIISVPLDCQDIQLKDLEKKLKKRAGIYSEF